jgi:hypothetical protein
MPITTGPRGEAVTAPGWLLLSMLVGVPGSYSALWRVRPGVQKVNSVAAMAATIKTIPNWIGRICQADNERATGAVKRLAAGEGASAGGSAGTEDRGGGESGITEICYPHCQVANGRFSHFRLLKTEFSTIFREKQVAIYVPEEVEIELIC